MPRGFAAEKRTPFAYWRATGVAPRCSSASRSSLIAARGRVQPPTSCTTNRSGPLDLVAIHRRCPRSNNRSATNQTIYKYVPGGIVMVGATFENTRTRHRHHHRREPSRHADDAPVLDRRDARYPTTSASKVSATRSLPSPTSACRRTSRSSCTWCYRFARFTTCAGCGHHRRRSPEPRRSGARRASHRADRIEPPRRARSSEAETTRASRGRRRSPASGR